MKRILLALLPFVVASAPAFAACHPSVFCGGAGYCFCETSPEAPTVTTKRKPAPLARTVRLADRQSDGRLGSMPQDHAQAPAAAPVSRGQATPVPAPTSSPAAAAQGSATLPKPSTKPVVPSAQRPTPSAPKPNPEPEPEPKPSPNPGAQIGKGGNTAPSGGIAGKSNP